MKRSAAERATAFLESQWCIKPAPACLTDDPLKTLAAITAGKWRRSAVDEQSLADTKQKLDRAIGSGSALEFSMPFGGYKSDRAATYPHLNWAEVFAVNFLRRYAESVASCFSQNVVITFSYVSGVMDLVNNMPLGHQCLYTEEFERLLEFFSCDRIQMRLFDVATLFASLEDLRATLRENHADLLRTWGSLPADVQEKRYNSAARNLQTRGLDDLSKFSVDELKDRITSSAMMCEALDSLPERRRFNKYSTRIQLVNVRGPVPSIHISSCDVSANHFGVGTGIVETRPSRCLQRIVTGGHLPEGTLDRGPLPQSISREFAGLQVGHFLETPD